MKLKKSPKPFTPSRRHIIELNTENLKKKPLVKSNINGLTNSSGRNNSGKITVRHKGCGHKKKYRKIEFYRQNDSIGIVIGIEYDPNRNANIASIYNLFKNNYIYIIAPQDIKVGDILQSGQNIEIKLGNFLPISKIPVGSFIHNVSGKFSRAAGTFSIIKEKLENYTKIELSSGKQKIISSKCYATIGTVSNKFFCLKQKGKAGKSVWLNIRPTVRGVAMNPVDHPHGGGEGKKSGKGKTPWGKFVKIGKTGIKQIVTKNTSHM